MALPAYPVETHESEENMQPRRLRSLGRIIPWPHLPQPPAHDGDCEPGLRARAEIRTRRFVDYRRVEEERYNAEITAGDSSLHSVMEALTQALAGLDDFVAQRPAGEPVVMEIRLRI